MRVHQVTILVFVVFLFSACKDESSEIGGSLFPENEIILTHEYFSTTTDIETSNVQSNSINFSSISSFIIGEFDDPKFGKTKADFLSQVSLGARTSSDTTKIKVNDNYMLDSTKLLIKYPYGAWIGDSLAKHKIIVYELTSSLDPLASYSSDFDVTGMYDATNPIGEKVFNAKDITKSDSIWKQKNYVDTVSIKINDELGYKIFDADKSIITDPKAFREFFKGIYVTTEKNDGTIGSLVKLSYRSLAPELVLYYKKINYDVTVNEIVDTTYLQRHFPINIEDAKVNRYSHDYTNSAIDFDNTISENLFVQSMAGSNCKINLTQSFIDYWKAKLPANNENTDSEPTNSIAGANLTFYIDTINTDYRNYPPPASLDIFIKNNDGELEIPTFENKLGQQTRVFRYTLDKGVGLLSGTKYIFTIENEFLEEFMHPHQRNIDRLNYTDFYIAPQNSSSNFNRVILHNNIDIVDANGNTVPSVNISIKYIELR